MGHLSTTQLTEDCPRTVTIIVNTRRRINERQDYCDLEEEVTRTQIDVRHIIIFQNMTEY